RTAIEDFITASQGGMDNGAFIMDRIHGSSVDIEEGGKRAVVKMKATITQRFELPPKNSLVVRNWTVGIEIPGGFFSFCFLLSSTSQRFFMFFEKIDGKW